MLEWWLYLKPPLPDDPVTITRQQRWGHDALAKVTASTTTNENQADRETGRPARYDTAIPNEYTHSVGIRNSPTC